MGSRPWPVPVNLLAEEENPLQSSVGTIVVQGAGGEHLQVGRGVYSTSV